MAKRKPKWGKCSYCGYFKQLERDHVPPQGIFPKPRPSDLITVGSCRPCNRDMSKHEEYFRLTLSTRYDVDRSLAASVSESAIGSLSRPEASGFRRDFLRRVHEVTVVTPDGQHAGKSGVHEVDLDRIHRVLRKITRGLYAHHFGKPLPRECVAAPYLVENIDFNDQQAREAIGRCVRPLLHQEHRIIGDGVFSYTFRRVDGGPDTASVWIMNFYRSVEVFAITVDESQKRVGDP